MSISPRFSSYVASIICNTIISTTLICSILSPPAFPASSDPFPGSPKAHCYSPRASLSDGTEPTLPMQLCIPCRHYQGHGSKAALGSTLPLTVSYKSISGPFRPKPKRKQASLIYFVDCWDPSAMVNSESDESDGNNDLSQGSSSHFGDNTYLKSIFDQYPFLYRIQTLNKMRILLPQDQDLQSTEKANELHHPLFRHKKLLSFKGFSSTSPPVQYSTGNKTRSKRKRTLHHSKNTGAMPPLFSQRRRYPLPRDIQTPLQNQRCCYYYPHQEHSGPYQVQHEKRASLLALESIANTWKDARRSVHRAFRFIQRELYHGRSQTVYGEDHTQHSHTPFRIKPHPKLESLASNLLVRSCLLIVLCMGAFWYCVTMMDQQQQHLGGSNWWSDLGSETAAPSSTVSSLGITTSGPTTSLGVDTRNEPLPSPQTPQGAHSAQDARPEPAAQHEDTNLSFLSAGIITAFIRSTAAAVAEYSPLSISSNSGSASTTPILVRSNALSPFHGSRGSPVESDPQNFPPDGEQAPKGRDGVEHVLDHTAKDPGSRKEASDRNPKHSCRDCFDHTVQEGYGVGVERGESSRISSRRSSVIDIEQDASTLALAPPLSPLDLSLCPFQTHFYNMDALASVLYMLMSRIRAIRAQSGRLLNRPLRTRSRKRKSRPQNRHRHHRPMRWGVGTFRRSLVPKTPNLPVSRRLRARATRLK